MVKDVSISDKDDPVLLHVDPPIGILTINRPHVRNAVDHRVAALLADYIASLEGDSRISAMVLTGAGGTFSAGMDVKAAMDGNRPTVPGFGFAGFVERPPIKPLIGAVEGYALGGGFEMVLACDLLVASTEAIFGLPEVRLGLVAAAGGLLRLAKTVPYSIAMEYALTGRQFSAERAYNLGIVNVLEERGAALSRAMALAHEVAMNAPLALQATKEILSKSVKWNSVDAFDWQRPVVDQILDSEDAKEGSRAFLEGRIPRWKGR